MLFLNYCSFGVLIKNNIMKMKKQFNAATLLFLLFTLAGQLAAQDVKAKFGLNNKNGEVILEQVYDEVRPLDKEKLVYMYRKGDKTGLYNFYDSTLYPCEYDEVFLDHGQYIIRKGNLFGFTIHEKIQNTCKAKVVPPVYTSVRISWDEIYVEKNSLHGVLSKDYELKQLVPIIAKATLHSGFSGYFYSTPENNKMLLRYDEQKGNWYEVEIGRFAYEYSHPIDNHLRSKKLQPIIVDVDTATGSSMTVYDSKTLKMLTWLPPVPGRSYKFSYHGMLIQSFEKSGTITHVTWYDPYTGNAFFTYDTEEKETINFNSFAIDSNMVSIVQVKKERRNSIKYTSIGVMMDYKYHAYKEPHVNRRKLFRRGSSKKEWKWLWWSGR
jgi:hypothetical protein